MPEKVPLFRTRKRRRADGCSYPWIAAETGVVNQFYCYCLDEDFGPFFLKFCSYFPFNAKLCINGNEWAKRQAAKAGIGFTPLDNAFAAVDDVPALDPHRFRRHHPKWHDGLRGENRKWDRLARSTPRSIRTRPWSW